MPDRTLSKQLAFKLGGSGGFGLAAFVFYVLSRSNQYEKGNEFLGFQKRCQLGLVGFCGLGLLSFPGEASFWPSALPAVVTSIIMIAVRIGGLVVALGGWLKDCTDLRWRKELQYGLSDNWRGLKVHDKKKSLFYRNCVFVIFFAILSNVMQAIFQYRYQDALELSSLTGSLHVSAVSRLLLVSSLLFSLKLASETETFPSDIKWQTNWALAAWAGLVGIGQCVSFHPSIQVTRNRIEMLTLSGLLFAKGLKVFRQSDATNERSGTFDDDSESDDTSQDDDIDDGEVGNGKDEV
ncbi:unnamed protein product [Cylindrotheca closterium]|nr:unnamed protein product [Cylindrotheca closterium]